jgi:hypothetical protein
MPAWLEKVLPIGLPAILGLVSGLLLSTYNSNLSNNRYFLEKQANSANEVAAHFSNYIENWRRLVTLRRDWATRKITPSEDEQKRLFAIADERGKARDKLFSSLDLLALYFDEGVVKMAYEFRQWDEAQADKLIDVLPEIREWQARSRNLMARMRKVLHGG